MYEIVRKKYRNTSNTGFGAHVHGMKLQFKATGHCRQNRHSPIRRFRSDAAASPDWRRRQWRHLSAPAHAQQWVRHDVQFPTVVVVKSTMLVQVSTEFHFRFLDETTTLVL